MTSGWMNHWTDGFGVFLRLERVLGALRVPMVRSPVTLGLGRGTGRQAGSGWISGTLSVTLGALGYGGVLCLLFPDILTTPDARPLYPLGLIRALIYAFLVGGFGLGLLSAVLQRRKTLRLTGIALALAVKLLRGSSVEIDGPGTGTRSLGRDWFLLNFLVLTLVFVPLERIFPRRPEQQIFRAGWDTDPAHFAVSHSLVQLTVLLTMAPAAGSPAGPRAGRYEPGSPLSRLRFRRSRFWWWLT